jgi:hypothetical protein
LNLGRKYPSKIGILEGKVYLPVRMIHSYNIIFYL